MLSQFFLNPGGILIFLGANVHEANQITEGCIFYNAQKYFAWLCVFLEGRRYHNPSDFEDAQ